MVLIIDGAEFLSYSQFFKKYFSCCNIHTFLFLFYVCGYLKSALFWNSHTKQTEPHMS